MIAGAVGVAALAVLAVAARRPRDPERLPAAPPAGGSLVRQVRPLMGTTCTISVWAPGGREAEAADAVREALDLVVAIERRVSAWDAGSDTSAVNRAAGGEAVRVGPELRELIAVSVEWSRRTGGAFDVTGGPLFELWDAARKKGVLPPPEEVRARLDLVGFDKVSRDGDLVRLARPGMKLGFGAIGEGFAADRAGAVLRARGFRDFIVDASGDLLVAGTRGGAPWDVAVRHPRTDGYIASLAATDCAVATSGDYERFFVVDGVRYSHILDLRTGMPARGAASVTVLASTATAADALATALAAMGVERGMAFIETMPDAAAMFVTEGGVVRLSKGLRLDAERLTWTR